MRKAIIYFNNVICGNITEKDDGYYFVYSKEYLNNGNSMPISLLLPLKEEEYFSPNLFPFFDNLIPEGWLLDIYSTKYNINKTDRFGLLLKLTDQPIGAVSIREEK